MLRLIPLPADMYMAIEDSTHFCGEGFQKHIIVSQVDQIGIWLFRRFWTLLDFLWPQIPMKLELFLLLWQDLEFPIRFLPLLLITYRIQSNWPSLRQTSSAPASMDKDTGLELAYIMIEWVPMIDGDRASLLIYLLAPDLALGGLERSIQAAKLELNCPRTY